MTTSNDGGHQTGSNELGPAGSARSHTEAQIAKINSKWNKLPSHGDWGARDVQAFFAPARPRPRTGGDGVDNVGERTKLFDT